VEVGRRGHELTPVARPRNAERPAQRVVALGKRRPSAETSEITGPWRERRTRSTSSGAPRTAMRSSITRNGRGPSGVR
jgi:hypothetical protein